MLIFATMINDVDDRAFMQEVYQQNERLMSRHACQYIRPDVCAVGGITTSKKIAALAEAHDVLVIPHNPLGPVSTAACLQICASIPNLGT